MATANINQKVSSNILTAIIAASVLVVLATAVFAGIKCYTLYGIIFPMP